jgi:hypothetical protein
MPHVGAVHALHSTQVGLQIALAARRVLAEWRQRQFWQAAAHRKVIEANWRRLQPLLGKAGAPVAGDFP